MTASIEIKLDVLTAVDHSLRPLSTSEVVERVSYTKPTVLKYLKQLKDEEDVKSDGGNNPIWWTGKKSPFLDGDSDD